MREKIIEILKNLHPEIDVATCDRLVEDGILDSLDIVTLVTELTGAFGLSIPAVEILPENFNSVEALVEMMERLDDV